MKVKNGFKYTKNGWIYLHIEGKAYERGLAHGKLLKKEIHEFSKAIFWEQYDSTGIEEGLLLKLSNFYFKDIIESDYPEYMEQLKGISNGADIHLDKIIFLNNVASFSSALISLDKYKDQIPNLTEKEYEIIDESSGSNSLKEGGAKDRCTAFIAIGDYTNDGKIYCGHNVFDNFVSGQYFNIIIDEKPNNGNRFLYQAAPGYISSQGDFYVNSKGFIVTETTMGGFNKYKKLHPIGCRIRKCIQYANTLEDYENILKTNNSGDYANSWLIGDTKNNEIMRIELGLEYINVERKKNGYFIGFNAAYDSRIRNLECINTGFDDIRRHQGARKVRLEQLMQKHKGKIDIEISKAILGDHFDVYLNKINLSSRTCCSHYELDDRAFMSQADRPLPFQPRGALDGCVSSTELASKMALDARWGTSCGTPFIASEFIEKNIQWKRFGPYLKDRPSQPWTYFHSIDKNPQQTRSNKKKTKNKITIKKY